MTEPRISYGLIDQTISEDGKAYAYLTKSGYSTPSDVFSNDTKHKLTYLEQNRILLDGTFEFPQTGISYDVGYEGNSLSDSSGSLSEELTITFDSLHDSYGIILNFATLITDFTVNYYNGTTLVGTITETGNSSLTYSKTITMLQWNKIVFGITKISNPYQRARLNLMTLGISFDFGKNQLISISASKAVSIKNDNTDSSECVVSFFNSGLFDIKTIKDLPVGLQSGMKLSVYFDSSLFNEYIVDTTQTEDEGKVITLTAYDRLYYLNDTEFLIGKTYPSGRSLSAWANEVAEDANIEITVDSSLDSITSAGYIGAVSHREALRMIAEAANCNLVVDADTISIVPFATTTGTNLTDDDIFEDTLDIENEDKVLGVKVKQYTFTQTSAIISLSENQGILLTGAEQTITADYSQTPASATNVSCSSNITLLTQHLGSEKAVITFSGSSGETGWITITGSIYNVASADVTGGYIDSHAKEIANTLITDSTRAESVRDFQLAHSSSNYNYTFDTSVDLNAKMLNTIDVNSYSIIISSISIALDESTETMTLSGEDA